eukprot:CAMPEP_0113382240 /NCGR_PEP_ID=MMETSP0013_2-20120614/5730_1 /TAXON_ID=2843 ORGANISM="Skeletonema costatum, Strain 1716" /NCGR_SAMPLE_ID=MMETSP0013_2 /ASSEMBLY_ACC=CAM_ASM_000158 /LENGTH=595 /DNA_ID=CAMNT_0000264721 /DNA_START=276 /DNA_END=2063 /DNA_ORIENTATION=- /assembly_acc=CAM_ASM_000158
MPPKNSGSTRRVTRSSMKAKASSVASEEASSAATKPSAAISVAAPSVAKPAETDDASLDNMWESVKDINGDKLQGMDKGTWTSVMLRLREEYPSLSDEQRFGCHFALSAVLVNVKGLVAYVGVNKPFYNGNTTIKIGSLKRMGLIDQRRYFITGHEEDETLVYVYDITDIPDPTRGWCPPRKSNRTQSYARCNNNSRSQKGFLKAYHGERFFKHGNKYIDLTKFEDISGGAEMRVDGSLVRDLFHSGRTLLSAGNVENLNEQGAPPAAVGGGVNHYGAGVGAGVPSMAGAGDGASTGNELDAFKLKTAELDFQKAKRIAELEVQQKEDTVKLDVQQKEHAAKLELQQKENMAKLELQQKENMAKLELQQKENMAKLELQQKENMAKLELQQKENMAKLELLTKVGATADRADSKADEALESSNNANERVGDIEYKVDDLADTVKKLLLSKPVDSDEGDQLARLVGDASFSPTPSHTAPAAAVDESDDNFDEVEVNNNIITPAPGPTSFASRLFPDAAPFYAEDNYRAFLRLLKEARRYGQDGKEMEMNSSLKKAEHIMLNTKLNEERNRWHTEFNNMSKCARKLCRKYGLKPAAR